MAESDQVHNYAYPNVASWLHSTSLAQFDGASTEPAHNQQLLQQQQHQQQQQQQQHHHHHHHHHQRHHQPQHLDDPLEASPDDFYRSAYTTTATTATTATTTTTTNNNTTTTALPHHSPADMAATRTRQPTANGAVRTPAKSTPRSASGPASSTATSRTSPQVSNKVKTLAERFERSPGSGAAGPTPAARSRSRDPTRVGAPEGLRRPNASFSSTASAASAARPSKEASYGTYKFNNLKPRERPQPAPASPRHTARRTTGSRSSLDHPASTRRSIGSPTKRPASSGRQPFFGEVLCGQDVTSPGYGIPTFEGTQEESLRVGSMLESPHNNGRLPATTFSPQRHERPASNTTPAACAGDGSEARLPEQGTPMFLKRRSPASRIPVATRRLSAASDSSSSHSVKYTPTRLSNHSNRASPTRLYRVPHGVGRSAESNGGDHSMLPALAYRGYRERGKSPRGSRSGPNVAAVVAAPQPPASPRLRNSRERQALQPSPRARSRTPDPHDDRSYFPEENSWPQYDLPVQSVQDSHNPSQPSSESRADGFSSSSHDTHHYLEQKQRHDQAPQGRDRSSSFQQQQQQQQHLNIQTSSLAVPSVQQSLSAATTDFEESPVLGIPGSFVLTPPTQHQEAQPELLQPTTFQPTSNQEQPMSPEIDQSELGVRESIPIMLGDDPPPKPWQPSPEEGKNDAPAVTYGYDLDGVPNTSRFAFDESPIDPFSYRDTLRPDDSASVAPHRSAAPMIFTDETYSVVNSVLNLYHQSPVISPELADLSRERVHGVSPVIAQHKDWGSKEATETFLARLLSDANGSDERASHTLIEEQPQENEAGGTAIIFPSESRCYSRGSGGSATTTIQDDASRSGSSAGHPLQEYLFQRTVDPTALPGLELPQLAWTNGGLGLSYHEPLPPSPLSQHPPPRPAYSPPPPPVQSSIDQQATSFNAVRPPYPNNYSPASMEHEQTEQHPARELTPVDQPHEAGHYGGALEQMSGDDQRQTFTESTEAGQPDAAKQALIKRYRILEELLTTEHQFYIDMMIAHNIFEATAQDVMTEKEKKILFSNCKELEKFSLSLFRAFKKASKPIVNYETPPPAGPWSRNSTDSRPSNAPDTSLTGGRPSEDSQNQFESCTLENDHLTSIGQVFLENKEKMERLYTTYYLNQENAASYIKKHQNSPELSGWVVACFEQVENMTQAWDLDSLLLKPCQRLLKYPLLLDGLVGSSDPDHPDLANIKEARKELLAMSARINEAKKRADTFRAATSEGKKEKTKGKGIGKTFVKAFIPKVDKSKAYDEADKIFKDQDYKSREQKFGGHFFQLQIVIRDFEQYLEAVTEHYQHLNIIFLGFISVCEVAPAVYPEIDSTWRKWAMAHMELQNKALEEHKASVRTRVLKPVADLWEMWVAYQKTIEQRKKYLLYYVKHKQALDRGEKVDSDLEESAAKFTTINDTLKHELPLLYERTKGLMRTLMTLFMCLQKDWYKTCSKKILPLLESEPQHTTSLRYDLESYIERFNSDYKPMQDLANRLGIINRNLLIDISNMTSPVPTLSSDGGGSSRNSSSRRTESMGSEASMMDTRNRHSGGYGPRNQSRPFDPPRSSPAGPAYPILFQAGPTGRSGPGPTSLREARALSPVSDDSEATVISHSERRNTGPSRQQNFLGLDGAVDYDDHASFGSHSFDFPPQLGASFLVPTSQPMTYSLSAPGSQHTSLPGSQPGSTRASGIFSSALPMSDSPVRSSSEDLPHTPGDTDEPEVLFLAASLFEFNIAHDRREGGIPYLVYVPGEIFDVIGMKGELWLARNQDDPTKTVGWIWEKHFARILPEDA